MPEIDADAFFKASGKEKKRERVPTRRSPRTNSRDNSRDSGNSNTRIPTRQKIDPVSEKRREEINTYPSLRIDVDVPKHFFFGSEYEPTVCWCGLDQYTMGHQDVNPAYCIKCGWFSDERHKDNPNGCKEING